MSRPTVETPPSEQPRILLAGLFDNLRQEGFRLRPDHYAEALGILTELAPERPHDWVYLLAPLVVTSEQEQEKFYRIFEKTLLESQAPAIGPLTLSAVIRRHLRHNRLLYLAGFVLLIAGFLYGLYEWYPLPVPNIHISQNDLPYQIGQTVTLQADNALNETIWPGHTYEWNLGDGWSHTDEPTVVYPLRNTGRHTVRLRVRRGDAKILEDSSTFTVCPQLPAITLRRLANRYRPNQSGTQYTFRATLTDSAQVVTQTVWKVNQQPILHNALSLTRTFDSTGQYTVSFAAIAGDSLSPCTRQVDTTFTINPNQYLAVSSLGSLPTPKRQFNPFWLLVFFGSAFISLVSSLWQFFRSRRPPSARQTVEPDDLLSPFQGVEPPFEIPFPVRDKSLIVRDKDFRDVVRMLRQRIEGETQTLHIQKTLDLTIQANGLPQLAFRQRLREEEYLFLLDASSADSQQLRLFEWYFQVLCQEGVSAERFFYQVPFGHFQNEQNPDGLSLPELAGRYANRILLIWGDGYPLLFDAYPIPDPRWQADLRQWDNRAILTPVPYPDWDVREQALQQNFLLLPADMAGLLRLMPTLREKQVTISLEGQEDLYSARLANSRSVQDMEAYLNNEDLFQWLCATAVYGRLRWEVLVEMGRAILPNRDALTYTNLLKLTRLRWMQEGAFPDTLRLELLKRLSPANEVKARETLLALLDYSDTYYRNGYFFDEEKYLLRTTNGFVLYAHYLPQFKKGADSALPDKTRLETYRQAAIDYTTLWQHGQLPDGATRLYLTNVDREWDNLLGTGNQRTTLDRYVDTAMPTPAQPAEKLKQTSALALAGLAVLLLLLGGYLAWTKPDFLYEQPTQQASLTLVFRPNDCFSAQDFAAATKQLQIGERAVPINFRNDTAVVALNNADQPEPAMRLAVTKPDGFRLEQSGFIAVNQINGLSSEGDGCVPVDKGLTVSVFYASGRQQALVQNLIKALRDCVDYSQPVHINEPVLRADGRTTNTIYSGNRTAPETQQITNQLIRFNQPAITWLDIPANENQNQILIYLADRKPQLALTVSYADNQQLPAVRQLISALRRSNLLATYDVRFGQSTMPYSPLQNEVAYINPSLRTTASQVSRLVNRYAGNKASTQVLDNSGGLATNPNQINIRLAYIPTKNKDDFLAETPKSQTANTANNSPVQTSLPPTREREKELVLLNVARFSSTNGANYRPEDEKQLLSLAGAYRSNSSIDSLIVFIPNTIGYTRSPDTNRELDAKGTQRQSVISNYLSKLFSPKLVRISPFKTFSELPEFVQTQLGQTPNWNTQLEESKITTNNSLEKGKKSQVAFVWVAIFGQRNILMPTAK